MVDEYGDRPFFKDGFYIYSSGEMVPESDMIVGAQSLDSIETGEYAQLAGG
jgi:hypothetical protein